MSQHASEIDVFISYKREDRAVAKALAEVLAAHGYSIWWDIDLLPGDRFADEIGAVIERASTTIVLWSAKAVASDYIRGEADLARQLGRLFPVRLDDSALPIPFNALQTLDLTGWQSLGDDAQLEPLLAALKARIGNSRSAQRIPETTAVNLHAREAEAEAAVWRSINDQPSASASEYDYYLRNYPDGVFAELARIRLARLRRPNRLGQVRGNILALGSVAGAIAAIIGVLALAQDKLAPLFAIVTDTLQAPEAEQSGQVATQPESLATGEALPPTAAEPLTDHQEALALERLHADPGTLQIEPAIGQDPVASPLEAGDVFDDCDGAGWCPTMVVVPAGSFIRGPNDGDGDEDERPAHRVAIDEPFAIGVYEVTFDEWDACVASGGCNGHVPDDEGWGRGRRPVIDLSWEDARAYVDWLNRKLGHAELYGLPTEAEWEYAARAGTTTPFYFGETISTEQANYDGNRTYGTGDVGVYREQTVEVGSFPANAFGLHDVHGNAREWVEDCYTDNYREQAEFNGVSTVDDCRLRVLRGGAWNQGPGSLRSANRSDRRGDYRSAHASGFRVARKLI